MTSLKSTKVKCSLCDTEVPVVYYLAHIPKCYRDASFAIGTIPLCTCNSCRGEHSHPGDTLDGSYQVIGVKDTTITNLPSSLESNSTSASNKRSRIEEIITNPTPTNSQPILETAQLIARECIICKSTIKGKIPLIHIGKYRQLLICKKAHISHSFEGETIASLIDQEIHKVGLGDHPLNTLFEGSDNENEASTTNSSSSSSSSSSDVYKCSGFLSSDKKDKRQCNIEMDSKLCCWIIHKNEKKYFCKGTHALRYLARISWSKEQGEKSKNVVY